MLKQPVAPTSSVRTVATGPLTGTVVMVVDDEALIRNLLKRSLESAGCTVILAENGEDALAKIGSAPLNAVITDVMMPRMDGAELATILRKIYPDLPIFVISAYNEKIIPSKAAELKIEEYIRKPFRNASLVQSLWGAISKRRGAASSGAAIPGIRKETSP